ncbi:universal stress protein [Actinoplanes sp. RD1]|uniref:universal stress protein n=1 Tax=Actinoplanes sp. RD1 TaxID=3064538 RepID=UPI002741D915|nr:universal stress protein [Actinoplanes sp. RD1]
MDAARDFPAADITLMHVVDVGTEAALSGSAGLLGRLAGADPAELLAGAEVRLFEAARARLARDADTLTLRGRPDHEVVTACAGADLLVLARDGEQSRLGPRSLGKSARFVVDHAPCRVMLVWPAAPPRLDSLP